jgi:pseudoazurin
MAVRAFTTIFCQAATEYLARFRRLISMITSPKGYIPMFRSTLALSALLACACAGTANATEFQIKMENQGTGGMMQFDPQLLKISPGDTVHFVAMDKGHNAQSIEGMIPAGARPFTGEMSRDLSVTLTVPGVYGYRCNPHGTLGMVGLIVVGKPGNEAAAKSAAMPGMAGRVFAKLFDTLDTTRTAGN